MAKLVDYIPEVIHAVIQAGEINQGDLTEAVWGTSGRGNTKLTTILFPAMVAHKQLTMRTVGRTKLFSLGPKGQEAMDTRCKARGYGPDGVSLS